VQRSESNERKLRLQKIGGSAGVPPKHSSDFGGLGGGDYYGGTSYNHAYAGSGGSSFISGHKDCDAVIESSNVIIHSGYIIHYSNMAFSNTVIIAGNKTMPLPTGDEDIWNSTKGAFRITLLFNVCNTCGASRFIMTPFLSIFISLII